MNFLKNRLEIFKINREIHQLQRSLSAKVAPAYLGGLAFAVPTTKTPVRYRESESDFLARERINTLIETRSKVA